jgi:protein-tyrosine sulfotransferase
LLADLTAADPIFILGILPRSGTNYLMDLLIQHPACGPARVPAREDLFLENSDHLVAFVESLKSSWNPLWGPFSDEVAGSLYSALGDGLVSFLWDDTERRLVTKSPSVRHVDRFFRFFPRARLVILVRDGRSVTQSCMTTFGWEFERAARRWAKAADEILAFMTADSASRGSTYVVVRYEDLVRDLRGSLAPVLRFLALDESAFDFEAAARLPVRGSSTYHGAGHGSVHWEPVPRGTDFDPTERWRSWSTQQHERFEWIAGEQLRSFGYRSIIETSDDAHSIVANRIRDVTWHSRLALRRGWFHARVRVGTVTRPLRERLGLVRP